MSGAAGAETGGQVSSNSADKEHAGLSQSDMGAELVDSGREGTDSSSLGSSVACSSCTDSSGVHVCHLTSGHGAGGDVAALKVPNTRQTHRKKGLEASEKTASSVISPVPAKTTTTAKRPPARTLGQFGRRSTREVCRSTENLPLQAASQTLSRVRSVDSGLDAVEKPVRGILRKRTEAIENVLTKPSFVFSRYNPQCRTLPTERFSLRPSSQLPDHRLHVRKSFSTLQNFQTRRPPRRTVGWSAGHPAGQTPSDAPRRGSPGSSSARGSLGSSATRRSLRLTEDGGGARLRSDWIAPPSSRPAEPASPTTSTTSFSSSASSSRSGEPDERSTGVERRRAARGGRTRRSPPRQAGSLEPVLEEDVVDDLTNTPLTLTRWYQAVAAARTLGVVLPLYTGLQEQLDPVTLNRLIFQVGDGIKYPVILSKVEKYQRFALSSKN